MNLELEDQHILVAGGLGGIGTKTVELYSKKEQKLLCLHNQLID